MEFLFDVTSVLPNEITRNEGGGWSDVRRSRNESNQQLASIVNKLGAASGKAQGLRVAITTYQKLLASSHSLYLLRDTGDKPAVIGLLKVGKKKLFLSDPLGVHREVEPLCVLDFYIHESRQRTGQGKKLFEAMLKVEGVDVVDLAIDRPSLKFLSFLKKHYKLQSYVKQGNNFVVFDLFFRSRSEPQTHSMPYHPLSQRITTTSTTNSTPSIHSIPHPPRPQPTKGVQVSTYNWSPEAVCMRHTGERNDIKYNILTGIPVQRGGCSEQRLGRGREGEKRAPLLTMREKSKPQTLHRLWGSSTSSGLSGTNSNTPSLHSCHQTGHPLGGGHAASRDSGTVSITNRTYSRHPCPPSHLSPAA